MLSVEMLPAGHGDCLWIEYGSRRHVRRILIDGGTAGTYATLRAKLAALPPAQRYFELLLITHIDADHISGVLKLLQDKTVGVTYGDVWFNGYAHLRDATGARGPLQGEMLSALLTADRLPWNVALGGRFIAVPDRGRLPRFRLPGGLRLTLLSPTLEDLHDLLPRWEREVTKAGLVPGIGAESPEAMVRRGIVEAEETGPLDPERLAAQPSRPDAGEPNGSSIAVLAEFSGRRVLLTGDAFAPTLTAMLGRLAAERRIERVPLDAFKLAHHGSQGNVSQALLDRVACQRYLFSTNGAYFRHPDRQAVARVLVHGGPEKTLLFNYRTRYSEIWAEQPELRKRYGYAVAFPESDGIGLRVTL